MGNNIYDGARRDLLNALINWPVVELTLSVWDGVPDFVATDLTIASIKLRGHAERGFSLPVVNTSVSTNGTAQTDNVVVPAVQPGANITWMTLSKKDPTVHDNSRLMLFVDEANSLPFVPNGLDMVIVPDWVEDRGWWRP